MKKITEERLKRAQYAIERGLLEDIVSNGDGYSVSYNGTALGDAPTLGEALQMWDAAEAGVIIPMVDEHIDPAVAPPPSWDNYTFDEDGYKIRRK